MDVISKFGMDLVVNSFLCFGNFIINVFMLWINEKYDEESNVLLVIWFSFNRYKF